ncbi:hypothetical protein NHF40_00050 [Maricaulaceae bacterium EIL42A08]|nr:hypothetical protein [Maricaulaceae bacterium EIL42A08]
MQAARLFLALVTSLGLGFAAQAAPVQVVDPIEIGDALAEKTEEYGERDIDRLVRNLTESVTERLERDGHDLSGGSEGLQVALTLENAWPNRPTHAQMSDDPSLSYQSVSLGGASVSAVITDADGNRLAELSYSWRTHTVADSVGRGTWTDARRTFDRFASQLADELPATAS